MSGGKPKIRVLIVDDSATCRASLRTALHRAGGFEVVEELPDGVKAVESVERHRPNVVALDLTMPTVGGAEAVRRIMARCPTPIVVSTSAAASWEAFAALRAGALEVVDKAIPVEHLVSTLRVLSEVRVVRRRHPQALAPTAPERRFDVVALGASTGGPAALAQILRALPASFPLPLLVAQHLAAPFVPGLVDWLDGVSELGVSIGRHGDVLEAGRVYLAPPGHEIRVRRPGVLGLSATTDPKGPGVDVLFESVAEVYAARCVAVLLTGMGRDGARGLQAVRATNGATLAQDQSTSVVFSMPQAAIELGAVWRVLPVHDIAGALLELVGPAPRAG